MPGFLTPNTPPDDKWVVRRCVLPGAQDWRAVFDGLLLDLCYPSAWQAYGDISPEDMAQWFTDHYAEFTTNDTETPYSDDTGDLDGVPKEPWYETVSDWIIEGFLAVTFTPDAAIVYRATVPKLRIAFRTGDIGAIFRVLINGIEVWTGDSYAPITGLIEQIFDTSGYAPPYDVRIEHGGVGEHGYTRAKLEYIRSEAVTQVIATILRADPSGCGVQWSQDNGDTWQTVDLAACIATIADERIQHAIDDGTITGPTQPPPGGYVPVDDCETFHVELMANQIWHSPVPIAAGYTVAITNQAGAWSDGSLNWYCPEGTAYFLGNCGTLGQHHETGDPSGTAYHMAIAGHFGDTWFDALAGTYQVSVGVADTDFYIQANDVSLGDNQGAIRFDVQICRPAAGSCNPETYDFSDASTHGWRYMTENEFPVKSYYNANTDDWRFQIPGGYTYVYGEGYYAGNYGIAGVLELADTCTLASVRVYVPDVPTSQHLVAVWTRQAGVWTVRAVQQIGQNANYTFTLDQTDVQAIAVTVYGNWNLNISKIETFYS